MDQESIKKALSGKNESLRVQDILNAKEYLHAKNYEPLRIIGAGSFGAVIEARNEK